MRERLLKVLMFVFSAGAFTASAQVSLTPLSSFGGGDGWLAPGEGGYVYLGTGNNERGLAYGNGHLYLVSRSGGLSIRVLNPLTGADLGIPLDTNGISGGTFVMNTVAVGRDGAIYGANLTTQSTTTPYKVYKWATESSAPTVAYSGNGGLAGARLGDSLAAIGSGSSTLLAAGFGSSPSVTGNNGYSVLDPTAGTATAISFSGTPPSAGDFRLGLTFTDAGHVIGTQGSGTYRFTSFSGASGTLLGSPTLADPPGATADRPMAFSLLGGHSLLAIQSTVDSHVSLFDVTDPANPTFLASANNTSGTLSANVNGTGGVAWGDVTINSQDGSLSQLLFAMSSNQGIQAFVVTVPEPGALSLILLGFGVFAWNRKARRQ